MVNFVMCISRQFKKQNTVLKVENKVTYIKPSAKKLSNEPHFLSPDKTLYFKVLFSSAKELSLNF